MRLVWSSCVFPAAFIGLAVVGSFGTQFLRAAEQADLFKVNSVWQGTCEQSNPKSSYPMILFVKQRKGDTFEGVTWYPTLGNGLVKVTGRTDPRPSKGDADLCLVCSQVGGESPSSISSCRRATRAGSFMAST